jgi:chaperonin GroEL (HSP60 family)
MNINEYIKILKIPWGTP